MYTITNKMYLFGNVIVQKVHSGVGGTLTLKTVYADYEDQTVVFYDVLYSELNEALLGKKVSVVVELPLEEMGPSIPVDVQQFLMKQITEDGQFDLGEQLTRLGYHVYVAYEEHGGEFLTIAKSVAI